MSEQAGIWEVTRGNPAVLAAQAELERGRTILDWQEVSRAPSISSTGECYFELTSCGKRIGECDPVKTYSSAEEAIASWLKHAQAAVGDATVIEWRVTPELGESDGRFLVYSRFIAYTPAPVAA